VREARGAHARSFCASRARRWLLTGLLTALVTATRTEGAATRTEGAARAVRAPARPV
jgi:xanthine/CO dehydrogenase XdhC/CoxF family maturation factor